MKKTMNVLKSLGLVLILCLVVAVYFMDSNTRQNHINPPIQIEQKLLTKEVTLSKEFANLPQFKDFKENTNTAVSEGRIKKGTLHKDGSFTFSLTPSQYKRYMDELKENIQLRRGQIIKDSTNPIVDIQCNPSFSVFKVYVDPSKYTESDASWAMNFFALGGYYRLIAGYEDDTVTVHMISNDTGKEIQSTRSKSMKPQKPFKKPKKNLPDVRVEDLPYKIINTTPTSKKYTISQAYYTNNSNYPIKRFTLEGTVPILHTDACFISHVTVMPGETSPLFESIYEKRTKIYRISYCYVKGEKDIFVDYDTRLKTYKIFNPGS